MLRGVGLQVCIAWFRVYPKPKTPNPNKPKTQINPKPYTDWHRRASGWSNELKVCFILGPPRALGRILLL